MPVIRWYGHACLGVTGANGTHIITDPYTPETAGYDPVPDQADVVIISSDNDSFHCRADLITGAPQVVNALALAQAGGETIVRGVPIRAIQAMEALNHREHHPDQNGIYRFEVDGVSFGHMGDIGNALTAEQAAFFAGVDVLFALTGGHPTIELPDLMTLIDAAKPKVVIPMHFRTLRYLPKKIHWVHQFTALFDEAQVDYFAERTVSIAREHLPGQTRVWVLPYIC
jgi:L-ascorbate metabolism protein UlaG (beta-lactamase superfamily)